MSSSAINLSTAGVKMYYAVEDSAGTMPTTGLSEITGIKSIPSLNPSPESLETTTLSETEFKTYIDGLKDTGGAMEIKANLTQALMDDWEDLYTAYTTAKATGKATWFYVIIPGLTKALAYKGNPSEQGLPAVEVNSVLETSVFITPTNAPAWVTKPTIS